ncbi:MAG: alpha/beta fold hydrolase [Bacteroidales bacterium]|nr:alpha/beta fold hydrolase [Bacteroidales bacterium]
MELFFRRYGHEGDQPLIIMHGLFGISDNWVTFGRRIAAEGFDVIIPDQRNHGLSPHSDSFNYLALTDDLLELIHELRLHEPIILGHSMGGKVAMRFALENPDMVYKLIVVDISMKAYGDRPHHRNIIEAMQQVDLINTKSRQEVEQQLEKRVREPRIRQFLMKNLHWKDKNQLEWRINLEGIARNLGEMFDAIQTETHYDKPTLFIRGGQSDYILPADYPQIRQNFPKAEIITIEGASHWVHAESPEQFYLLCSGFLSPDTN